MVGVSVSIRVTTSLLGVGGFPASHPLWIGMRGMHGEACANHAIQEADLLLAFGMRVDDRVTGNLQTCSPHSRKIHIDIDTSELNKNVLVDLGIHGELRTVLSQLRGGVAKDEMVYPMVSPGASLNDLVRRPHAATVLPELEQRQFQLQRQA